MTSLEIIQDSEVTLRFLKTQERTRMLQNAQEFVLKAKGQWIFVLNNETVENFACARSSVCLNAVGSPVLNVPQRMQPWEQNK